MQAVGLDPALAEYGHQHAGDERCAAATTRHEAVGTTWAHVIPRGPGSRASGRVLGPVVPPAPKGEAAGKLWTAWLLGAGTPGFYELKAQPDLGPIIFEEWAGGCSVRSAELSLDP